MDEMRGMAGANIGQNRLLGTLERLLAIEATELRSALNQSADLLIGALGAEKIDVSVHEPSTDTLVALGISDTPMGRRQQQIGMDRLPVANGGRVVEVYQTGEPYMTGRADEDPVVLIGFTRGLSIRSFLVVPLVIDGERRGAVQAASSEVDAFTEEHLRFLGAVASWVGMVAHRAELTQKVAQDAAEAARRATADELVTALAHDLGNYLVPLKARVDLLGRRAIQLGDEKISEHAREAQLALSRLQKMIGAMLDVARLDRGMFSLTLRPVDLAHLARDVAVLFGVKDGGVDVRASDELVVSADPDALRQALENLLSNARRHSPDGVPVVLEVMEEQWRDGKRAVIEVRDQGPGIPSDLLPRLFDRFASGKGSKGLGLGLYLARGIAEAHGGTMTVDSKPGKGAAFRLTLPLAPRA
jgi:signal transduction histidine kinase